MAMTTLEWKKRERHYIQVNKTLREGGEMDAQGRLRSWFGRKSLDRLKAAGHSAVGYEQCDCRNS